MSNLSELRNAFVPILNVTREQYLGRVPAGYPNLIDDAENGTIGLELDPSYGVYLTEDETGLYAELYKRDPRIDARATAGRQKYAGAPISDRRMLERAPTEQELRNLVAELKASFNTQPGIIYITED